MIIMTIVDYVGGNGEDNNYTDHDDGDDDDGDGMACMVLIAKVIV